MCQSPTVADNQKDHQMTVLGFDVGGANIKLANDLGYHHHQVFPLWMRTSELPAVLKRLLEAAPPADQIALTMTGELTDCFKTKREGVEFIIDSMMEATELPVFVYLTGDEFVEASMARFDFMRAAASNWFGLASFVSRMEQVSGRSGLLIDIGSTTCDIIPFQNGICTARGTGDFERLREGELVYTGALRSPLCGIVDHLKFRGDRVPVMNELFATMLDVNIILGRFPTGSAVEWAADHCGTSLIECTTRLARMLGLDRDTLDAVEGKLIASQIRDAQLRKLEDALTQVVSRSETPQVVVVSGQGEFTARELCERFWQTSSARPELISMDELLGPGISGSAPAYAIANLAQSRFSDTRSSTATSSKS